MDLIRSILLLLEEHERGYAPDEIKVEGFTEEQVGYHCHLIYEAGLADGYDETSMGDESPSAGLTKLTWQGHEFIDAARQPGIWEQTKSIMHKAGGGSFQIWSAVLTEVVKKSVGL